MGNAWPSRLSPRRLPGLLFWAAALLVVMGLVLPLVHVNRFRRQIQLALENSLGREVQIGAVSLNLLTGPGFHLENVIIGEDPAFGIEHFAYMSSMQVRLRLRTLWTGRIQVASLTLSEPSINLVKNAQGRWNFETLIQRSGKPAASRATPPPTTAMDRYFPYVGIQDGRVNFKFGDYKSVIYFQDVEAALSPARDPEGRWRIRVAGKPARTDRTLSGMGLIRGEGELSTTPGLVRLNLGLEPSPLEHLLSLAYGRDFGVHAEVGAQAQLTGPVSQIGIQGAIRVADLHRWDLLPIPDSRFVVAVDGRLDVPAQRLEIATTPPAQGPVAVLARVTLENYLTTPQWSAAVELNRAPAEPLFRAARQLGAALPAALELRGSITGQLQFPGSPWPRGRLSLDDGRVLLGGAAPVVVAAAQFEANGPEVKLTPVALRLGRETIEISGAARLDERRIEATLAARNLRLTTIRHHLQALKLGWLEAVQDGFWEGRFTYTKQGATPGAWSAAGSLSRVRWQPRGFESPIEVAQARVRAESGVLRLDRLRGALGEARFTGNCDRNLAGAEAKQTSCQIQVAELDLARLDRWLNPQQKLSRWEAWKRAIGVATPEMPAWLKTAQIRGTVNAGVLRIRNWTFRNVRSDVSWKDETLALDGMEAELAKGSVRGGMSIELTASGPRYNFEAEARGLDLRSLAGLTPLPANVQRGAMDLDLALASAGRTWDQVRAALTATGRFEGRAITLDHVAWDGADDEADSLDIRLLAGRFELSGGGLQLSDLRMAVGKQTYLGRGSIGGTTPMLLDVASNGKQSRLVASAKPEIASDVP